MPIRIWHQSFADLSQLPGYRRMLEEHAVSSASPGTVVDVHGARPGTYPEGIPPVLMHHYLLAEHLITLQVVENGIRAEREGYDAFISSCFLDPGLDLTRSVVSIPVISAFDTSLTLAATVGRRFGLITLDNQTAAAQSALVRAYGKADRTLAVEALDPPVTETDIDGAFRLGAELVEKFVAQAARMIARGADVIVPVEGLLNTVMVWHGIKSVEGCPVIDSFSGIIAVAEALVGLHRRSGLTAARRGAYAKPPEAVVEHLRRTTEAVFADARLPADPSLAHPGLAAPDPAFTGRIAAQ